MTKWEFAQVRLESVSRGRGTRLLTMFPGPPVRTSPMPGGATESNMYRWLSKMGSEGWYMVSAQSVPNSESKRDIVFWLQREVK